MQEGNAILFKRLADIDVFDLEFDGRDPDHLVEALRMLEPTFGGIHLRDICAPEGLVIYDRLQEALGIPVFNENYYASAIVVVAALINALDLTDKKIADLRIVICGAGNAGLGCARLLTAMGAHPEGLLLYDIHGLICPDRSDLNDYQAHFARDDPARTMAQGIRGADVFIGASAGGVLTPDMIRDMNAFPVVFATAAPDPEIAYDEARAARRDVIVATSNARSPNAIVDLLSFPYVFRGALDVQATRITEAMMLAAARSLAELAQEDVVEEVCRAYGEETFTFGPEYLLPKPIDPRILVEEAPAVAAQAVADRVARAPVETPHYVDSLIVRLGTGREVMRSIILKARRSRPRIVLPEGTNETVLRACSLLIDEEVAQPMLLGDQDRIRAAADHIGVDLSGVSLIDPSRDHRLGGYVDEYFRLRARRGVTHDMARRRLEELRYVAALMLHMKDADMMISGITSHYAESLRTALEVIGPAEGVNRISGLHMIIRPEGVYFLADCAVNIEPDAAELAEIAVLAATTVRTLGFEPRVAMLAFSNFGSSDHRLCRKVREATEIARRRAPEVVVEGEMQLITALDGAIRARYFPFSEIRDDANVLVFPDLQSGNLALHLLQKLGDAVAVGPLLMGTRRPVHLLQYGFSSVDVLNLAALGVVASAG
jgi:malate dehydrogenase (oxaloacetate-decarboxylating)(NADP+)